MLIIHNFNYPFLSFYNYDLTFIASDTNSLKSVTIFLAYLPYELAANFLSKLNNPVSKLWVNVGFLSKSDVKKVKTSEVENHRF